MLALVMISSSVTKQERTESATDWYNASFPQNCRKVESQRSGGSAADHQTRVTTSFVSSLYHHRTHNMYIFDGKNAFFFEKVKTKIDNLIFSPSPIVRVRKQFFPWENSVKNRCGFLPTAKEGFANCSLGLNLRISQYP